MTTPPRLGKTFLLTVGFGCAAALAGTFNFDLNSDPATILNFCGTAWDGSATSNTGSASWVSSGGAGPIGNTATGPVAGVPNDGFLRLTFASPDCSGFLSSYLCGGVLFNDFDVGMVVAGFTFECDLRIGNGGARPADGFSLSYVRADDPVLLALAAGDTLPNMNNRLSASGGQFADNGSAGDLSLIEEGTQTGLSIGFDLWASGGYTIPPTPPAVGKVAPGLTQDDIGLDVRVDGTLLTTIPMPNLQPVSGDDPTSLVTGPYDGTGCDTNLAWVHLKADLDAAGVLNVWYKNTHLLSNVTTRYYPSPGRLLLAARVGAATANIEVDNIQITTLPASEVVIGPVTGTATGFSLSVADSGPAVADPATVQVRLNGTPITPAVSKTGRTTTIRYDDPAHPFPPGATITVTVSLRQTNGQQVGPVDRTYVVPEPGKPPTVVAEPEDATAVVGTSVSFAVTAKGTAPLAYSWRKDDAVLVEGGRITGVNTARLSLTDVLASDAGRYQVVVSNPFGFVTSRSAGLTVSGRAPGQKLWEFRTGGMVCSSPALGTGGTVYVGSYDRKVYALDGKTGQKRWDFSIRGTWGFFEMSSPAIGSDGTVYIGSNGPDYNVYALDGATGQKLWESRTGGAVYSSPAIGADGTVYVGSSDGRLYALDGTSGAKRWQFQTGGWVTSSPALAVDGTVYVGSDDYRVYALDGATGKNRWVFQAGTAMDSSPAIGADGTVYAGSQDGKIYALNGATGQKLWQFAGADQVAFTWSSSPAVGPDGTVYVGSRWPNNKVHALNGVTGAKRWEFRAGYNVVSSPAIGADGTVYVGSDDDRLYALDGTTGKKRWEFQTGGAVWSSPAVGTDGTVYVGSNDGKVYAITSNSLGGLASSCWPKFHANARNQGQVRTTAGPPRIVTQSAGRMVVEGTPLVLEVMAEGASPLSYQWLLNGQLLAGQTGSAYRVSAWAASQAGAYRVQVGNTEGLAESADMVVTLGYAVTVGVVGPGRVNGTNDAGIYAPGTVLELTAVADEGCSDPGCSFIGWNGDVSGQSNRLRLTVDRTWRLTATFGGTTPGTLRWEFLAKGPVVSSPAIAADGTVYVAVEHPTRSVYAVNAATGQRLWAFEADGCCNKSSSPAAGADGLVYVGAGTRVYALDGATGERRWDFQTGSHVVSSPAVSSDGTVYVASDKKIHALNGATGQRLWEFLAGDPMADTVTSSPAIGSDGTVYVGLADTRVCALRGATGQKLWEFQTDGMVWSSPAVGSDGTVYVGSSDNKLYALHGTTGEKRWEFQTGGQVWSSPVIGAGGTVYVGSSDNKLYALNGTTGQKLWEFQTDSMVWSSPAIGSDGTVYVGSYDNKLYALDGTTGQKLWEYRTGTIDWSSPAIGVDGTVYVGSVEGSLYALSSSSVGGLAQSPWPKFRGNAQNTGRGVVAPVVLRQPSRVVLNEGATGRIVAKVGGEPAPNVQWFFNGEAIPGATEATLTIPSVTRTAEGIYTLVASNTMGQVTSQPILALVSNVDPQSFVGLKWEGTDGGPVILEATSQLGETAAWHSISNYPPSATPQVYVELDPVDAARFYRLNGADRAGTLRAGFIPGWWFTQPAGTTHQIEYVSAAAGWTNWLVLTNLTLPASPHLFLDTEAFDHPGGVYRTTPMQ